MTQVNDVRDAHVETTHTSTVSPWQPLSQHQLGLLLVTLLGGGRGALAFLLTALFALAYRRFVVSRLGGQTGDTLGAGNELFEVWFLLMLC